MVQLISNGVLRQSEQVNCKERTICENLVEDIRESIREILLAISENYIRKTHKQKKE